jgi:hypothetical protein
MSLTARRDVLEFFDRYQRGADTSDPDVVRDCFAETFLDLDPRGAGPVPREALIQALPGRAQPFATIGVEALELTELSEQPLDELHTMVTTTWRARIAPDAPDAAPLELPSQFLLRRHDASWQILVHLTSTDLAAVLAERTGRTPGKAPDDGVPRTDLDERPADEQPTRPPGP